MTSFDKAAFASVLETKEIGRKLVYTDITGSTMDDAWRLAHQVSEFPHGTAVLSERQTKARGARDHKWDASNMGNIYASFILHMPPAFRTFEGRFDLEVAACLAVLRVCRKFGLAAATPKWPNDVWVRGHKLAGFLAEDGKFSVPGSLNCLMVLGMGINVNSDLRRSAELGTIATSIRCEMAGVTVDREKFFADICAALEHYLHQTRAANVELFRQENLFQTFQDISASCPSEGRVVDGKFLEICDNWEVRFTDKSNDEIFQGRSDYYTIRPKVLKKILVVFTGLGGGGGTGDGDDEGGGRRQGEVEPRKVAQQVAAMLQTLLDTSRYVVCLVPESFITDTDEWPRTCSLLILSEPVGNPAKVRSKLNAYFRLGGKVFACGSGAVFLAEALDVPVKELDPSVYRLQPESPLVSLNVNTFRFPTTPRSSHNLQQSFTDKSQGLETDIDSGVAFNTKDFLHKNSSTSVSSNVSVSCYIEDVVFCCSDVCLQFYEAEKLEEEDSPAVTTESRSSASLPGDSKVWAVYSKREGEGVRRTAACVVKVSCGNGNGHAGFLGIDIGFGYSGSPSAPVTVVGKEQERLSEDRFKRDQFIQQIVESLL